MLDIDDVVHSWHRGRYNRLTSMFTSYQKAYVNVSFSSRLKSCLSGSNSRLSRTSPCDLRSFYRFIISNGQLTSRVTDNTIDHMYVRRDGLEQLYIITSVMGVVTARRGYKIDCTRLRGYLIYRN